MYIPLAHPSCDPIAAFSYDRWRTAGLGVLCLLTTAASVTAQTVSGRILNDVTATPVGAGFVVLVDETGTEWARTLSAGDGTFSLRVPQGVAGRVRVRSERIGFQSAQSEPFELSAIPETITIRVRALGTPLADLEVTETTECDIGARESERTAVAWEEARKALAAATWTESQVFTTISNLYEQDWDGRRDELLRERHRLSRGYASPFRARNPQVLVDDGYIRFTDPTTEYSAPDPHVMQDPSFLDTHCFSLRSSDDPSLIGLAFDPVPSRRLPDVKGVLWLVRETSGLKSLEYEYTRLPTNLQAREPGGGRLEFMSLPSGAWIVQRWEISIPTELREVSSERGARFNMLAVDAYRNTGGEVLSIADASGRQVYQAPMARVSGVVLDSLAEDVAYLSGAVVTVEGTWFADTADAQGRFDLAVPLDGRYPITFTHPRTDSVAFNHSPVPVQLVRGEQTEINLTANVAGLRRSLDQRCPAMTGQFGNRVLTGFVRDSARGTPRARVTVLATWQRITAGTTLEGLQFSNVEARADTDSSGRYTLCGLEVGRPTQVYVLGLSGELANPVRVEFDDVGVALGDEHYMTTLGVARSDHKLGRGRSPSMLVGVVSDAMSGRPIPGAQVALVGQARSVWADADGLVRIADLRPGEHRILVRQLGFRERISAITVTPGELGFLGGELLLEPVAQVYGRVVDAETGEPVPAARVTLLSSRGDSVSLTRADSSGGFVLTAPVDGSYTIVGRGLGYIPGREGPVELTSGRPVEASLSLTEGAYVLDAVSITAEAVDAILSGVGFYDRQAGNFGTFLDRAYIESRLGSASNTLHLLSAVPGVSIVDGLVGSPGGAVAGVTRGVTTIQTSCSGPKIYVNGFPVETAPFGSSGGGATGAAGYLSALNDVVSPEEILGVEVYRSVSQVPAQYGGPDAACGVILMWTIRANQ